MSKTGVQVICKSVFKSGENTTTKNQYTKQWIDLINQLEKGKRTNVFISKEIDL